ncbi:MAG: endolytic transglycosylase MltG [Acidobacteriota bacterium]|nr:endolytic transglycosylase MltG [Acidobacteriota bacterium]
MKFFAFLLLIALLCAATAGYVFYAPAGPADGTSDDHATYVDIAPGSGTHTIAAQLQQAAVIRSRYAFYLLRALKGGKLIAGEYRFNHLATATEVYSRIVRGDVYFVPLTIPEGFNIFDIAQAVESAHLGSREAFLAAERSQTSLISDLSPNAASLEGYLFPDTYRFGRHSKPTDILAAMVRRFRQVAAQLGLASGPNLPRTVTMASLVEKEVAQPSERPLVSGVFVNRIARNMPLATDPSVVYAALLDGRYRGAIHATDLQADSPYNTYRHTGLPPGPISNPGVAALKAAIAPATTDYLYFVADAQGHSRFSTTLKEHSEQVQTYRRAIGRPVPPPRPTRTAPHPAKIAHHHAQRK